MATNKKALKIAFAGAGGVGAYFGAKLCRAGGAVQMIARGAHAEAMARDGVSVTENGIRWNARAEIIDGERGEELRRLSDCDWIIFTCKTHQTRVFANSLKPYIDADTNIASLQNGVDNPSILQDIFERKIAGGLSIQFASHIVSPGSLAVTGKGYINLGEWPTGNSLRLQSLVEHMYAAGIDCRQSADIRSELWRKLIINNGVNPVTALLGQDSGTVLADPETRAVVIDLMDETIRAASTDGVKIDENDRATLLDIIDNLEPIKSSMQVDIEKGKEPELEGICGAVLERAEAIDGPSAAPVTRTLQRLLTTVSRQRQIQN